ncbi:iron-siderophore ABC transporter substrate-binding protein [Proteiniclasticum sp.]|uniref:iron-siderophore ABC transporter substrate-binding protein n=1 Tax=Proteiniclasticum sp. TaxID=2053595 RepID=UPI0025CD9852|nr:iron-siderophore ABC transporter substrate-binding protein [Proteiniclasticum sp.]
MKKIMMIIASLLLITAVFTGCGAAPKEEAPEIPVSGDEVSQDDVLYPMTIQHAFGETVLEKKPERIATISWGNQDVPLALGVVPVGVSMANYGMTDGSGLLPWTKDAFKSLGVESPVLFDDVAGLNYEAIYKVAPDVILASYSGITQEEYDLLSEIAPVVPYQNMPWQTFWRDQITENSEAIGMKEEGEALVKDLENLITEKLKTYPELTGKSAAFFYFSPQDLSKFYIYLPADPRAAYLEDLQMVLPESVKKLQEENKSFAVELSAENVDLLTDVDLVITYGTEGLLETLQNDPLIGTMEAVKRGSVVIIEDGTPLAASGTPSALSIPATIDEYLKLMSDAAKKVQ